MIERNIKMDENAEIKFTLMFLISLFIHLVFLVGFFLPDYEDFLKRKGLNEKFGRGRDIIVNINQDSKKIFSRNTLLSDQDSSAKGFVTRDKGDQWLNNFRDFIMKSGGTHAGRISKNSLDQRDRTGLLVTDNAKLIISLMKFESANIIGKRGKGEFTKIPDKNSFNRKNAIFYSNDGRFSFNTARFKNFKYFKKMKDIIAAHWFPPLLANSIIYGYDPFTGSYTPGRVRIMAIPNQLVKVYFTMNRNGDVLNVTLIESMGNRVLEASCVDAIRLSKNFGKVPDDIKGNKIHIPFMFGYYVY